MTNETDELDDMRKALSKANEEAKKYRLAATKLETDLAEMTTALSQAKTSVLQQRVAQGLQQAGVERPERVLDLIQLTGDESDDDIQAKIATIQQDLPELFDSKRRAGDIDAANKTSNKHEPTTSELLAAQILH